MEPKVQTSFIPKKSLAESAAPRSRGVSILMLLGVAVFLITILLAGGVFLYERFLEGSIESKDASLQKARAAFEPALIEDLKRMSARMSLARGVLNSHLAPSTIFTLLEEATLRTVRFRTFTYTLVGEKASIAMHGEARSFGDVAIQSDTFANTRRLRDPIFSNLNLDSNGNITFNFAGTVDPGLILYRNQTLSSAPPSVPAAAPTPIQTPAPSPATSSPTR